MSKYFTEALHNFTSDYAYGSQIKSLYSKGLSCAQIKQKLDYPASIETVSNYLWDYLINSHQVVFNEADITTNFTAPKYELETDTYGRRSFRLSNLEASTSRNFVDILWTKDILSIPNANDCYIRLNGRDVSIYKDYLDNKQLEYMAGFPWPKRELYIRLNDRLIDIMSKLQSAGVWNEIVISPADSKKYIFK